MENCQLYFNFLASRATECVGMLSETISQPTQVRYFSNFSNYPFYRDQSQFHAHVLMMFCICIHYVVIVTPSDTDHAAAIQLMFWSIASHWW